MKTDETETLAQLEIFCAEHGMDWSVSSVTQTDECRLNERHFNCCITSSELADKCDDFPEACGNTVQEAIMRAISAAMKVIG